MRSSVKMSIFSVLVLMAAALPAVEYVIEAPNGVGDVVALTNAFAELNKAETTNAKLLLKPGVYDLSGTMVGSGGSHFRLDKKMKGGLIAGTGDSPGATIIKGGGENDKLRLFHFWLTDKNNPMVVSNLTLTGGYSNSDGGAVFGSVDNYGGNLILSHVIVSNNYAKGSNGGGGGGAIHVKAYNCVFASNVCGAQHGGGLVLYSNANGGAWDCVFSNNTAVASKNGGGLYILDYGTVSNCTFIGNSTAGNGGGLYMSSSSGCCFDSTFTENSAKNGAGAYVSRASLVDNCVFNTNSASSNGGGFYLSGDGALLNGCKFYGNVSKIASGAYIDGVSTVTNCIFKGNGPVDAAGSTKHGGGLYLSSGECVDCNFIENNADSGGGAYVSSNSAIIRDCLFDGNIQTGWASGAAVYVNESSPLAVISNCVFNANVANVESSRTIISNAELVDCVITNHSVTSGYVLAGCNMIRCLFAYNSTTGNGQHLDVETFYGTTPVSRTNVNCIVAHNKAMGVNSITDSKQVINCTYYDNYCDSGNYGTVLRGGVAWNTLLVGNRISGKSYMDVRRDFQGGETHQPYLTNCVFSVADIEVDSFGLANCKKVSPFTFTPTADGGVYDIKKNSPAFNAGVLEDWMLPLLGECDFAKRPRVKYNAVDVGALECQFVPPFAVILR